MEANEWADVIVLVETKLKRYCRAYGATNDGVIQKEAQGSSGGY